MDKQLLGILIAVPGLCTTEVQYVSYVFKMSRLCSRYYFVFQIDNKGNHLLVSEEASINVPAIAAAHVTKRYTAQATDELTFEVTSVT